MNVDFLLNQPNFSTQTMRVANTQRPKAEEEILSVQVQAVETKSANRAPNPAEFIQKIKGTNDAAGFLSTATGMVEELKNAVQKSSSDELNKIAQSFSFQGKNPQEPQTFNTTSGHLSVALNLPDFSLANSALGKEELSKALDDASKYLSDTKIKLSTPVNKMQEAQKASLQTSYEQLTQDGKFTKLGSLLTKIDEGFANLESRANELGNKIF